MTLKVAIYERSPSKSCVGPDQATTNAENLEQMARSLGWAIEGIYCDSGISGISWYENWPAFAELLTRLKAEPGAIDLVLVRGLARFGRNMTIWHAAVTSIYNAGAQIAHIGSKGELEIRDNSGSRESQFLSSYVLVFKKVRKPRATGKVGREG